MKILFTNRQIAQRVEELGKEITSDYQGSELLVIGVLKGGFIFVSDLVRHLDLPVRVEFVRLSSYGCSDSPQCEVKISDDTGDIMKGKHILIVDDIMDTGKSIVAFKKHLESKGPASVKICTMINKKVRRTQDVEPDYYGFTITDGFIVGYGLDFAEDYRALPEICVLEPSDRRDAP
ncbi:MAG: hypoxanthine phosphoribosyltransferase [Deltaproteobacteria bacterium]|nr:hypoxanthine phosphoribosyltransferase [Deltaproteobacteria bacterium]